MEYVLQLMIAHIIISSIFFSLSVIHKITASLLSNGVLDSMKHGNVLLFFRRVKGTRTCLIVFLLKLNLKEEKTVIILNIEQRATNNPCYF